MTTPSAAPAAYTLEQAQGDIATLRGQLALMQEFVSTVSDKAVLLYAPGANAIPRGPTSWSFEDGTVDGWTAINGAVTNSTVTATGWPTAGTHSLLLTASGAGAPQADSPTGTGAIPTQPGDPVAAHIDIYCPAAQTNVYAAIVWLDDTGAQISFVLGTLTAFSAGQVQTLYVAGTAPDLTAFFYVAFGSTNTLASGQLIYGDNIQLLGNLAISASPGGGTDPVGNPYDSGYEIQGMGAFRVRGVLGQIIQMQIDNGGIPILNLLTGVSEEGVSGAVQAQLLNSGQVNEQMVMFLAGAEGSVHTNRVWIDLLSQAKDGSADAFAQLVYGASGVTLPAMSWGVKGARFRNGYTGDTSIYQGERYTMNMPSSNPLTINTLPYSQAVFTNPPTLGVGTYRVRGMLGVHPNQAAGAPSFGFAGGAAYTGMRIAWKEWTVQTGGFVNDDMEWVTGPTPGGFSGTVFSANDRLYEFDGTVVVSTAGTCTLYAGTSVTTDTYSIYGYGSHMEIYPIGP